MVRLQLRASVFSQDYQIRVRIKIRDFELQEFASLAASRGSRSLKRPISGGSSHTRPDSQIEQTSFENARMLIGCAGVSTDNRPHRLIIRQAPGFGNLDIPIKIFFLATIRKDRNVRLAGT